MENRDKFFSDLKKCYESFNSPGLPEYIFINPKFFRGEDYTRWCYLCAVWNINSFWNGNLNTLEEFLYNPVKIYFHERPYFPTKGFISLEIDGWTSLSDIKKIWPKVEKYQKKYLLKKVEGRSNFGRDLCWYDLFHKHKLSIKKIIKMWDEKFPEDIDLFVIKRITQKDHDFFKHLKKLINEKSDLKTIMKKEPQLDELLNEIKSGLLHDYFYKDFIEEREYYTYGKTKHGKFTPPFFKTIEQAIKRMDKFIKQLKFERVSKKFDILEGIIMPSDEYVDTDLSDKITLYE